MFYALPTFVALVAFFSFSVAPELPEVPGAKMVRDLPVRSSQLVHYLSSEILLASATHALIVVHGKGRDAFNSFTRS
jgi:hypothetical protein